MTWPMALGPVGTGCGRRRDGGGHQRLQLGVGHRRGQVPLEHRELGPLPVRQLGPLRPVVGLGRLPALLRLPLQDADHLGVAELLGGVARDLVVGHGGQRHPQGGGGHLVPGPHRVGQVGLQTVLQLAHPPSMTGRTVAADPPVPCHHGPMHPITRVAAGATAAGLAGLAYGAGYEVRAFRLRRETVPVLPPGQAPIRVLHLTDLHLTPGQRKKQRWVRALAALEPDLVIDTGDNLAHPDAVAPRPRRARAAARAPGRVRARLERLLRADAEEPGPLPGGQRRHPQARAGRCPGATCRLAARGRVGRPVQREGPGQAGRRPRDRAASAWTTRTSTGTATTRSPGRAAADADLSLGVIHAPYHRVLDAMAADGLPLVIAGHTHGGQLCVPFYGALVSNCDLSPRRAKGLSQHTEGTLAARVRRARHLAVRTDPVRLPSGGDAAHPGRPGVARLGQLRTARLSCSSTSGCGAAW